MADSIAIACRANDGEGDMSEQRSVSQIKIAKPEIQKERPNDTILKDIRNRMGDNADLLRYLPVDSVHIDDLNECHPRNMHPYRLHFGQVQRDGSVKEQVGILLSKGEHDGPPKLKYLVFSAHGHTGGYVSVADAIVMTRPAPAFEGIAEVGGMDKLKLRAVVRYYFIAKKIDLPSTWPLDGMFIKELISACKVAEYNAGRQAGADQMRQSLATELLPHLTGQSLRDMSKQNKHYQDRHEDTYEDRWMNSISLDGGRKSRYSGQYIYSLPLDGNEPDQNELMGPNKENIQTRGSAKHPTISFGGNNYFYHHPFPHRKDNQDIRSPLSTFTYRTNQVGNASALPEDPSSSSATPLPVDPLSQSDTGDAKDHLGFIASYETMVDQKERYNSTLKRNKIEQAMITEEIQKQQAKLAALRAEEKKVQNERKWGMEEKERLCQSLPENERAFLNYGLELGMRKDKRAKLSEDGVGDGSDTEE